MFAPTREQTGSWKQRLNRFFNATIILAVIILAAVLVRHYLRAEEVEPAKSEVTRGHATRWYIDRRTSQKQNRKRTC